MRLGLYFDLRNPRPDLEPWTAYYRRAIEECVRAEELGAHSVWFSEHHGFNDGYLPQPLTFAAAVAARTTTIRLGTAIVIAPLRSSALLAEEAAVVDLISGGRLELGLGAGYLRSEFELYGIPFERPTARLFEQLAEIRRLYASGQVTPPPADSAVSIWAASNGPRGARLAGAAGEKLLSANLELVAPYLDGRTQAGLSTEGIMGGPVNIFLSDHPERDRLVALRGYQNLWRGYDAARRASDPCWETAIDAAGRLTAQFTGRPRDLWVATIDDAAHLLEHRFARTPVQCLFSWAMIPGVPRALMERHVELWSRLNSRLSQA